MSKTAEILKAKISRKANGENNGEHQRKWRKWPALARKKYQSANGRGENGVKISMKEKKKKAKYSAS
jgi:hypothetical protein